MADMHTSFEVSYGTGSGETVLIKGPDKFYPSVDKKKITTPMTPTQFAGLREAKVVNRVLLISEFQVLRELLNLKKTSSNYVVTSEFSEIFDERKYSTQVSFFRKDEASVVLPSRDVSDIAAVSVIRDLQGNRISRRLAFKYEDGKLKCSQKISGTFQITQKVAFLYFDYICHARSGKFYLVDDHYELLDVSSYGENSESSPSLVISFYTDKDTVCGTYTASAVDMSTDGKSSACTCGSTSVVNFQPGTDPAEVKATLDKCIKETAEEATVYVDPVDSVANSMWTNDYVPEIKDDGTSLEGTFGTHFYSRVSAVIKGVRFYKSELNTGEHLCTLWDVDSKTLLESVTSDGGETASGRQVIYFNSPVPIEANKRYCVAYHSKHGHICLDDSFSPGTSNLDLFCLGSCFKYGPPAFPSRRLDENYYVDVVYEKDADAVYDENAETPIEPEVVAPFSIAKDFPISNQTAVALTTTTTYGNEFVMKIDALLESVSFRSWSDDPFPPKIRLYDAVSKALLFSADTVIETPITGWKTVALKNRYALEAGKKYILAVYYSIYRPEYSDSVSGVYTDYRIASVAYIRASYYAEGDVCPAAAAGHTYGVMPIFSGVEEGQKTYITDSMLGKSIYPDTYPIATNIYPVQPYPTMYGTVFTSDVAGSVTALRYFRVVESAGATTLALWDVQSQTMLGYVAVPASTSFGWQTVALSTPIMINASTQYLVVAAYPSSVQLAYLNTATTIGKSSLHLTPILTRYGNGTYINFPAYSQSSSFFADVVFEAN